MMVIFSGTEGASQMASNMVNLAPMYSLKDVIFAVLDGPSTVNNGQAGATVLDDVRARYNIDNDRTFLIGESAGTGAALQLGLKLRQSYFAAYWANDVVAAATPAKNATALGFAPWGNAGPGGQAAKAQSIVDGMRAAGYRLPADAPYSGAGAGSHGSPQQFMAALSFFGGKSRK
jgi:pimeloyl-ACP methyl ester carboxylesterase